MKSILKKEEIILRIGLDEKSISIKKIKKKYNKKKLKWNPKLIEICENTVNLNELTSEELDEYNESRKDMFSEE